MERGSWLIDGFVIERLATVDSTNRLLADMACQGAPQGTVVVAAEQTVGRGRLSRSWIAPAGTGLLASVLLRPPLRDSELFWVMAAVSLAARDAARDLAQVELRLKWPNDLISLGGRKAGGLLAERPSCPDASSAGLPRPLVVGIGLNVAWPPCDGEWVSGLPPALLSSATALSWERPPGVRVPAPGEVLDVMLAYLRSRYLQLGDPMTLGSLRREYRASCATIGREVRVDPVAALEPAVVGTALDVTDTGALLVAGRACIREIQAGDVHHLRDLP